MRTAVGTPGTAEAWKVAAVDVSHRLPLHDSASREYVIFDRSASRSPQPEAQRVLITQTWVTGVAVGDVSAEKAETAEKATKEHESRMPTDERRGKAVLLVRMAPVSWTESFTQLYLAFNPVVEKKQSPMFPKNYGVEVAQHQS